MNHDQAALDLIHQWKEGEYHDERQKQVALQCLIVDALEKVTQNNAQVRAKLINIAADMALGKGFVPCLPEDLPSSTPRSILLSLELQDARVKHYAADIGSAARKL